MRSEIKLFEDQYKFFKDMKSKRLLVAFVEFMFEDIEPSDLKWLEKTVFESMRKRMENSKKIHDGNSKGWSSSHWGWRPPKDSWELEWENKSKTSRTTTQKQLKNNEEWSMKIEEKENVKRKFLDYVYLSDVEYKKISDRYWERVLKDFIERLDNWIWEKPNSKNRKDRDHYRTILQRIKKEWVKEKLPPPKQLSEYEIEDWVYDIDKLL